MATTNLELKGRVVLFRMKSDQFADLPRSDQFRLELLDGEVVMSSRPSPAHQHFSFQLAKELDNWIRENELGMVLPDTQLELDEGWMPVPDLTFLNKEHLDRIEEKLIRGPVDLVVEVLSPNDERADREIKFEAYAKYGLPWYWIVDLVERELEEYHLISGQYRKPVTILFDKPFKPRLFKGLTIDLASLELRKPR